MPRPRRIHAPKTKRVPLAYQLNDELAQFAALLHGKFEVHFASLASFKIGYVLISGGALPKRGKIDGWAARFLKVPPLWKGLTGYDAIVEVREAVWKILSAHQREALLAHELSHGDSNDKGDLVVQKHDLEEFAWIARHYGAWDEGIELFGKQLSLFGTADGAAAGEKRPNGAEPPPPKKDDDNVVDLANAAARARRGTDHPVVVTP